MGRIARGWKLSMKSFALIEHDRRLLLFPLLSIAGTLGSFTSDELGSAFRNKRRFFGRS